MTNRIMTNNIEDKQTSMTDRVEDRQPRFLREKTSSNEMDLINKIMTNKIEKDNKEKEEKEGKNKDLR